MISDRCTQKLAPAGAVTGQCLLHTETIVDKSMMMATLSSTSTRPMKAVYDHRALWSAIQKRRTPAMPIAIANKERVMLIGAPSASTSPTTGARIGISR